MSVPLGVAQLRAEADQAAAVGGLRRERTRRQVVHARAHLQRPPGSRDERNPGHQRAHVDARPRHRAGDRVAQVVVVPDLAPDRVEAPADPGTNRREYAFSGWSVSSQHRRSTPISAASWRARSISASLSFQMNRM